MSDDFYESPKMELMHVDGWGYGIEEYDDGLIRVFNIEEGVKSTACLSLFPESARKLAGLLVKMADMIKPEAKPVADRSIDFQNGFLAGVAYSECGADVIKVSKELATTKE